MRNRLTVKMSDPFLMIDFYRLLDHTKKEIKNIEISAERKTALNNLVEEYLETIENAIEMIGNKHTHVSG